MPVAGSVLTSLLITLIGRLRGKQPYQNMPASLPMAGRGFLARLQALERLLVADLPTAPSVIKGRILSVSPLDSANSLSTKRSGK
jgi:hypothetical protein